MLLYLYGSPMEDLQVSSADGTVAFAIETHPYLNDRRTEVYNADGEVLGSIIWAGSQPSHICVYSDNAVQSGPFQMIPRSDPASSDQFDVVAGDGTHDILWSVDRKGLRAHYPITNRKSPLIADYCPQAPTGPSKRKSSEGSLNRMELDCSLSEDVLGRFWVSFVLLDMVRKTKYRITETAITSLEQPSQSTFRSRMKSAPERLKDLTIGFMLQPRRWSL